MEDILTPTGEPAGERCGDHDGATARRRGLLAYVALERATYYENGFDVLDDAIAASSLDGAAW